MNLSDVELSESELTNHVDSAGNSALVFFSNHCFSLFVRVIVIKIQPNTDTDVDLWCTECMHIQIVVLC